MITGRLLDKILILTLLFVAIPRNRLTYTIISSVLFYERSDHIIVFFGYYAERRLASDFLPFRS